MAQQIELEFILKPLFSLLEETFATHHGIYLDRDTSFFPTLAGINARQASIPVGGKCASLAAQVAHIIFYFEVLERYIQFKDTSAVDWGETWRTVEKVSPSEWNALREQLSQVYTRFDKMVHANPDWNEDALGGVMAVIAHSAYHLGEIRQALCILDPIKDEAE